MKTTIMNLLVVGFVGVAAAGLAGCADTETTAYEPPVEVVHEPTTVTTEPATTSSTTVTTQYSNGAVEKRTTTDYNPAYTTVGPPYKTTVVPAPSAVTVVPAPSVTTTRTTTVTDE